MIFIGVDVNVALGREADIRSPCEADADLDSLQTFAAIANRAPSVGVRPLDVRAAIGAVCP